MKTALLINGAERHEPLAQGRLNALLHDTARDELTSRYSVVVSDPRAGYTPHEEHEKFLTASLIVFQFPVFWFSTPPTLKRYIDDVYAYGTFFGPTEHYGRGGLLGGRKYLVSTTWNANEHDFGAPETVIGQRTVDDVLLPFHLTQQYVGLEQLPSFAEHDVTRMVDVASAAERLRAHLRRHVIPSA